MGTEVQGVPETYIEIIRDMYRDSYFMFRTAVSDTTSFLILSMYTWNLFLTRICAA